MFGVVPPKIKIDVLLSPAADWGWAGSSRIGSQDRAQVREGVVILEQLVVRPGRQTSGAPCEARER
jgi:hypothetical protein